ncbi:MAG: redoxin domain-containing protein [Planctomycetaceae bacterium]|jgi:thiol-disulfide isomerase/thioredoxin|nr:redoxin domain-containing protein [Planctomycetaceae bacterium]
MKNIALTRVLWIAFGICIVVGFFVAQNRDEKTNIVAAETLEKADTVKKIKTFLLAQRQKVQIEQNKILTEINKLKTEDAQREKFRELSPQFFKFIADALKENILAGEKILTLAKDQDERSVGYNCLINSYSQLSQLELEELYQKKADEKGLKKDNPNYDSEFEKIVEEQFAANTITETQKKLDKLIEQMKKEGQNERIIRDYEGEQLSRNLQILSYVFSINRFNKLKDDAKKWSKGVIDGNVWAIFQNLLEIASSEKALATDNQLVTKTVQEITEYVDSDNYSKDIELRKQLSEKLKGLASRLTGTDLNLYGQTINNDKFNWNALRGKIVLVKFTASWCQPCKMEIPNMLKAYEKYHDKGLEIVSVYIFENDENQAVDNIKNVVKEEKIPWIILCETLTQKAGDIIQSKKYSVDSVPTMLLVGKDGKVIATNTNGNTLNKKLTELFDKK